MKRQNYKQSRWLIGIIFLVLSLSACNFSTVETGSLETKTESVEIGSAEAVIVDINMGFGQLSVAGGASDLMDAEFQYNVAEWEPEITYKVNEENGRLTISQPGGQFYGIPNGDVEYTWNLQFNNAVPLELDISLGAGESQLDLGSLAVERLSLETGAGEAQVRLGGSPLRSAEVQTGAGESTIDLTGEWVQDAFISIEAGVGQLTVMVPADVGVIVDADVGIGNLNASGFRLEGKHYVNDAYGTSPVTLTVDLQGGIGDINLQIAP